MRKGVANGNTLLQATMVHFRDPAMLAWHSKDRQSAPNPKPSKPGASPQASDPSKQKNLTIVGGFVGSLVGTREGIGLGNIVGVTVGRDVGLVDVAIEGTAVTPFLNKEASLDSSSPSPDKVTTRATMIPITANRQKQMPNTTHLRLFR